MSHNNDESLAHLRHSAAHLLAAAVMELYPHARRTIGPATEDGFYYDFDFSGGAGSAGQGGENISLEDLPAIEEKMRELVKTWEGFERTDVSAQEAKDVFAGNDYKIELIEQFAEDGQTLTLYKSGAYVDLCRGGHCEVPKKELQHFKLLSVAGAYWRGDASNPMLTRIYGTAFASKQELKDHMRMLEEAKKRDHRKLGKELDLFHFSDLVGPGLPLFTQKGTIVRELLRDFIWKLMKPHGYQRVCIPHIAKAQLYKVSGHWDKFADDIFHVSSQKTDEPFVMKPMNCPHHAQLYASRPRSYRDLPIRMSEVTAVYRDENTGQLQGLSRVRSITQDDAHVFCTPDQVHGEVMKLWEIIGSFYDAFGMPVEPTLSLRDPAEPEKYLGTDALWNQAEQSLRSSLDELGLTYKEYEGEAAFYGPKIDFVSRDAIGRKWQLATIQLDFNQPERFRLTYTDVDGVDKQPVMIHRAVLGSVERFMGMLIEHYAGAFPLWLAPVQVQLVRVGEGHQEFCEQLRSKLEDANIRVSLDDSSESVGKKIRLAAKQKIPWTIVVGDKEVAGEDLHIRVFGSEEELVLAQDVIISELQKRTQKYT